jgi:carnitine O-acetyltransferase
MFQHQESLPRLPIPSLEDTCRRYIEYSAPLLSEPQLNTTKALVAGFQSGVGRKLHEQLKVFARHQNSYIEQMWDDAYLLQRSSITINTSPYLMLEPDTDRPSQTARAARLASAAGHFLQRVRSRTLTPDMERTSALDMSQYDRVLATARIPGLRRDHMSTDPSSRHAMVMVRYVAVDVAWHVLFGSVYSR